MTRQLVLIHGRDQQNKDAAELKQTWIKSLREGLAKSGLELPIGEDDIRFPYYGDTLDQLNQELPPGEVAKVIIKGEGSDDQKAMFVRSVVLEIQQAMGITDDQVLEQVDAAERTVIEKGVRNWGWVQKVLETLDKHVPGASGAIMARATADAYRYLHNPGIRATINIGVAKAFTPGVETVVVGHSLGSAVAYWLLKNEGHENGWKVPLFLTVGSPLGVRVFREAVAPRKHPRCVGKWFNAMDSRDVVSLYPLDERNFSVDPPIENKTDVDNFTENRHGIVGYLSDAEVAKRIHDALVAE